MRTTIRWIVLFSVGLSGSGCSGDGSPEMVIDDDIGPTTFLSATEIVDDMARTAADFPSITRLVDVTATYAAPPTHGGSHLYALKISDNPGLDEDEAAFLMVSAHHGNEIGTPVVALDAIRRLTRGYATDPEIRALVDEYEIWIAPLWNPDGYPTSRKNGAPGGGVDLNRNYPFAWDGACSGSTNPVSNTYKGPTAGSEPETVTMMAFSEDRRFAKVLDYHSSGREALHGYRCEAHHLGGYLRAEAVTLSFESNYGGAERLASAEGEHYQWQLWTYANFSFLTEISDTQTPTFVDAQAEAELVWPGTLWLLQRPIPVRGHVKDDASGDPVPAMISYIEAPFGRGEQNRAEPRFGRYHAFLPSGVHTLRFEHPEYISVERLVEVGEDGVDLEVTMTRR